MAGTGEACTLNDVEAYTAAPDHSDRFARLDAGGVERCPETGDDGAPQDAGQLQQRNVAVDRRDSALVEQDVVGQRTDVGHLADADPIEGQAWPVTLRLLRHARVQAGRGSSARQRTHSPHPITKHVTT